ncbi:MAG: hypothetical protein ACHREM_16695 [Polyangiales bacterium]
MKRSQWKLRSRYGASKKATSVCTLKQTARLDQYATGQPGDRVEVGAEAANKAFLVAFRIRRGGRSWETLGPFANVAKSALRSAVQRRS